MAISGAVSIPSAIGSSTILTVSGQQALAYAQLLQHYLDDALEAGSLNLSLGIQTGNTTNFNPALPGVVNEAVVSPDENSGAGIGTTAFIAAGYQAFFDNVNGPSTVVGSGTSTDGILAGLGSAATFIDNGGNNAILFVNGNDLYVGDTVASAASDTIYGGTGLDTIDTGYGFADVYAGVGRSLINTNDASPVSLANLNTGFNDYVYLADGEGTVNADGLKDAIIASAPGQLINAALSAQDYTDVVLQPVSAVIDADTVNANLGLTAVFDFASGNSIIGGSGTLLFMGGTDVSASVFGGAGTADLFGAAGDTINWTQGLEGQSDIFVAGQGNESLNAAGSQANLAIYAYNGADPGADSQARDTLIGGAGNDTLVSGAGYETLDGGAGNNEFLIVAQDDSSGAHITINDFGASSNNLITFSGYSQDQVNAALDNASIMSGVGGQVDTVFTLSDNTTVTVVGIDSLVNHTYTFR